MQHTPNIQPYIPQESYQNIEALKANPSILISRDFSKKCEAWFETQYPGYTAYTTPSATRGLELAALLLDIHEGDEIIMPTYNFAGAAAAFANFGATLVFVDVDANTLNLDYTQVEAKITPKTKAIVAMHYGGAAYGIDELRAICNQHNIVLIEDNAHGIGAKYNNQLLGSFGDMAVFSFDAHKNITCGEGGMLLVKNQYAAKAEQLYEYGTNKRSYQRGQADNYMWLGKGSKFYLSEFCAAILYGQLVQVDKINAARLEVWNTYYNELSNISELVLPNYSTGVQHNAHLFFIRVADTETLKSLQHYLKNNGVELSTHYVPLHFNSGGDYPVATAHSAVLLKLPVSPVLTNADSITTLIKQYFSNSGFQNKTTTIAEKIG